MPIGVCVLCWRNWLLGAGFVIVDSETTTLLRMDGATYFGPYTMVIGKMYYLILTGNDWPIFPSIAGFIVTLGTFAALLALVWRSKALFNFPLSLGITVFFLLVPYWFAMNGGYAPRFSIHLLPLALLSLMIFLNPYLQFKKRLGPSNIP